MGRNIGVALGVIFMVLVLFVGYVYHAMSAGSYETTFINNEGNEIGTVSMNETEGGVIMYITVDGLTPNSEHAMHVHETGDCSPQESFKNAGGHYNPFGKAHGMMHPEGFHAGDMPNLRPNPSGHIEVKVINQYVTLNKKDTDGRATLFDKDGSAIIIHAKADDHKSQPSGAAGDRIACAVID